MDKGQIEFEPDRPLVPAFVSRGKYQPDPLLYWVGFNFEFAARPFTVHGLSLFDLHHYLNLMRDVAIMKFIINCV